MRSKAVGFIGLGRMGSGMALNLLKSLDDLYVFDPLPDAMAPLTKAGALACDSAADIATKCDLIFLCLPFAPQVRAVIFGPEGIASASQDSPTIVDTTTLDREDALLIAEDAAQAGIEYWDCPISGMPFRAHDGTLTVMFGGTRAAFDKIKPYLESFGEFVVHCGDIGSGQAMKAINNVIYNINIAALCEMLPLSVAVGLDPEAVARVVTSASSRSFASDYFVPRMMERRFDTDFAMGDAYKDIVNVQRMGVETRALLPVVNAMIASYQATMAAGHAAEPKSAILKMYEKVLDVEFKANRIIDRQ
jgi:3-hydroxyisobutyrate dehydrogenase-like beta-hydroxyacid dehydrogenase